MRIFSGDSKSRYTFSIQKPQAWITLATSGAWPFVSVQIKSHLGDFISVPTGQYDFYSQLTQNNNPGAVARIDLMLGNGYLPYPLEVDIQLNAVGFVHVYNWAGSFVQRASTRFVVEFISLVRNRKYSLDTSDWVRFSPSIELNSVFYLKGVDKVLEGSYSELAVSLQEFGKGVVLHPLQRVVPSVGFDRLTFTTPGTGTLYLAVLRQLAIDAHYLPTRQLEI